MSLMFKPDRAEGSRMCLCRNIIVVAAQTFIPERWATSGQPSKLWSNIVNIYGQQQWECECCDQL